MLSLRFSSKVRSLGPVSASGRTAFSGGARATSSFSSPSISLMRCATSAGPSCAASASVLRQSQEQFRITGRYPLACQPAVSMKLDALT